MIKLTRTFDSFEGMIDELTAKEYKDEAFPYGFEEINSYEVLAMGVISYIMNNIPGFFNPIYPNCATMNITPYGISYMKDSMGLDIHTNIDRKTGDVRYDLSFIFNKDRSMLKHNSLFIAVSEDESYKLIEIERKPRAPKTVKQG